MGQCHFVEMRCGGWWGWGVGGVGEGMLLLLLLCGEWGSTVGGMVQRSSHPCLPCASALAPSPRPLRCSPWVVNNCLMPNLETCELESAAVVHTGVSVVCGGGVARRLDCSLWGFTLALGPDPSLTRLHACLCPACAPPLPPPPTPTHPLDEQKAEDFLRRAQQLSRFAGGPFDFMSGAVVRCWVLGAGCRVLGPCLPCRVRCGAVCHAERDGGSMRRSHASRPPTLAPCPAAVCPPYELVDYNEIYDLLHDSPLLHEASAGFGDPGGEGEGGSGASPLELAGVGASLQPLLYLPHACPPAAGVDRDCGVPQEAGQPGAGAAGAAGEAAGPAVRADLLGGVWPAAQGRLGRGRLL